MPSRSLHLVVASALVILACSARDGRAPTRAGANRLAATTAPGMTAPGCLEEAPGCSSGVLLMGPDATGPELNAPNTIDPAFCPDVPAAEARYAVQAITVSTPQGASMQRGRAIDVEVSVSAPPGELGMVQLWYTAAAGYPPAVQWRPIPLDDAYATAERTTVHASIWPDQEGLHAVRASIGPPAADWCGSQSDSDDLLFVVAPTAEGMALAPEDGTVVTGLVPLALQVPDTSLCRVEYVVDGVPEALVGSEPPFFPAVWDSSVRPAGAAQAVTVRADAFRFVSDTCVHDGELGRTSLRLATEATCDPAWGRPTCSAPSAACGSVRLAEGARPAYMPYCGGLAPTDPAGPIIERILVRSRDGQPLAPGVSARVEVELGGPPPVAQVGVAFMAVDLAVTGTSQLLGVAENVGDAVSTGRRVGVDFVVGPPLVRGDPVALQYVMAVVFSGGATEDEVLAFAAPDRTAPVVELETPRGGAVLTNPVVLRATARDADRVESVTFHDEYGQTLGSVDAPPYELSLQLPEGDLRLTAVGYDPSGNARESAPVVVTVDVTPPYVFWRAPDQGAAVHGTATLSVYAIDPGQGAPRAAERVEFWTGETLIGTVAAPTEWELSGWPRWDLVWDTAAFASGPQMLRAVAIDRVGLRSEVTLSVVVDQLPTVRLVRPVDGERASRSISFAAEVWDDLAPPQVEFLVDGQVVGSASGPDPGRPSLLEAVWTPMSLSPGSYRLMARACDPAGQCVESAAALVQVVDETPPQVSLTAPLPGAVLSGTVVLQAKAWDDVGVTRVEYYANGTWRGSATAPPYTVTFDPAPFQGRTVTLVAVAYDGAGNPGASEPVAVTVRDTTPPSVSLTTPVAGTVLFKTATLTASASDNAGVQRVQFLADGLPIASDDGPPYTVTWDVRKVSRGTHLLTAMAVDAAGNAATSPGILVVVK